MDAPASLVEFVMLPTAFLWSSRSACFLKAFFPEVPKTILFPHKVHIHTPDLGGFLHQVSNLYPSPDTSESHDHCQRFLIGLPSFVTSMFAIASLNLRYGSIFPKSLGEGEE